MNIGPFEPGWSLVDALDRILEGGIRIYSGRKRSERGYSMRGKRVVVMEADAPEDHERDIEVLVNRFESKARRQLQGRDENLQSTSEPATGAAD